MAKIAKNGQKRGSKMIKKGSKIVQKWSKIEKWSKNRGSEKWSKSRFLL